MDDTYIQQLPKSPDLAVEKLLKDAVTRLEIMLRNEETTRAGHLILSDRTLNDLAALKSCIPYSTYADELDTLMDACRFWSEKIPPDITPQEVIDFGNILKKSSRFVASRKRAAILDSLASHFSAGDEEESLELSTNDWERLMGMCVSLRQLAVDATGITQAQKQDILSLIAKIENELMKTPGNRNIDRIKAASYDIKEVMENLGGGTKALTEPVVKLIEAFNDTIKSVVGRDKSLPGPEEEQKQLPAPEDKNS